MARSTPSRLVAPPLSVNEVPGRSVATNLLISLRPGEWTKNLVVFAGLIFSVQLFNARAVLTGIAAFAIFCALSGVVYLVNDVADRESDRQHPLKRRRPIAAGAISATTALGTAIGLGAVALAAAFAVGWSFGVAASAYVVLQLLYSGPLKHIVIIDVLTIAIGFVLRAAAGALAIDVSISQWLFVCTILLALFIALAKRRHELVLLADSAVTHRPILGEYNSYLLDQMIAVVTASTLVAYAFYTISPETTEKFDTNLLGLTIPFPLYGIFRYLYLVHRREGGGSPATLLVNDRPLLGCVLLWIVCVVVIIYWL
jgi:4-hydroxybenzoate polyprenyltransferase